MGASTLYGAGYAHFCVLAGVFVTAFYSFRMYFLVFHGKERFGYAHGGVDHAGEEAHVHGIAPGQKPHESPWVVTVPLVLLAIPSVLIGFYTFEPLLAGDWLNSVSDVIRVSDQHVAQHETLHDAVAMGLHGFTALPFLLALAGVVLAAVLYLGMPTVPGRIAGMFRPITALLENKYFFDRFNEIVFAGGARALGNGLWWAGDRGVIDGVGVNGSAKLVKKGYSSSESRCDTMGLF